MSCSTSMGEFLEEFNYLRHSFPFLELEQNFEPLSQLTEFTGSVLQNQCKGLMDYSNNHYLPHQEFAVPVIDNSASFLPPVECQKTILKQQLVLGSIGEHIHEDRKRKPMAAPDTNSELVSELFSEVGLAELKAKKINGSGSGKRHKRNSKEKNNQKEVVHVRARRGQATDSHSLAERERRKKINERMRRLQDHVPGCNKTMGMARMLDEIISYVQSLQNQVEFLSMELSAASYFQDYIVGAGSLSTVQAEKEDGAREPEKLKGVMEGHGDCTSFHSSVPF